jgi:hypothetical protein
MANKHRKICQYLLWSGYGWSVLPKGSNAGPLRGGAYWKVIRSWGLHPHELINATLEESVKSPGTRLDPLREGCHKKGEPSPFPSLLLPVLPCYLSLPFAYSQISFLLLCYVLTKADARCYLDPPATRIMG